MNYTPEMFKTSICNNYVSSTHLGTIGKHITKMKRMCLHLSFEDICLSFLCFFSVSKRGVVYLKTIFITIKNIGARFCKDHGATLPKVYTQEEQDTIMGIM